MAVYIVELVHVANHSCLSIMSYCAYLRRLAHQLPSSNDEILYAIHHPIWSVSREWASTILKIRCYNQDHTIYPVNHVCLFYLATTLIRADHVSDSIHAGHRLHR